MKLTWLGHASWLLETDRQRILIDPFLTDNPSATITADELDGIDTILVSHGHSDHTADVAQIANRCHSMVIANFEIAHWFAKHHHVKKTLGMNLGGGVMLPSGRVQMTTAVHSSSLPDGSYGGNPGGFYLQVEGQGVYFACDTALFSDMRLIGGGHVDVAILPIGDLFTMGPEDSLQAIKWLTPQVVLPSHYGTWPPIAQDARQWAARVAAETKSKPLVPAVGDVLDL